MSDLPPIPGLVPTGVAGVGATGPILAGEWNGRPVTIRHVRRGSVPLDSQLRRLQTLRELSCDHVAKVLHVEIGDERLTVLTQLINGPPLTTVRAGRSGLTLGEGWRVLADLCTALDSLHTAGVIHGDVSPANVIVRSDPPQGRAVMIDVGGEEEWELGTVGFRAPEISSGEAISAASDIWAAARTALWAVAPEHRAIFAELLRDVLQADPAHRPDAAWLRGHAEERATARIDLPDEARLATAHLRAQAARKHTTRAGRRARRKRESRRTKLIALLGMSTLVLAIASFAVLRADTDPKTAVPETPPGSTQGQEVRSLDSPLMNPREAVVELTAQRDRALVEKDLAVLNRITAAGSEAALADRRLLESFGGSTPVGLHTSVKIESVAGRDETPVVGAMLQQAGFTWQGGTKHGIRVSPLPARCAQIHLVAGEGGWQVQRVRPCGAEPSAG